MTTEDGDTFGALDQLLSNYRKPEDLTGEDGLFKQLKKALIERALGAELSEHLGYERAVAREGKRPQPQWNEFEEASDRGWKGRNFGPARQGGNLRAAACRQRPDPVRRVRRRGILSLYARGMTVREIQGHLSELYALDVSPDLIAG